MPHPANRSFVVSGQGLALIQRFESYQSNWYLCPAGKKTIGFGHVQQPGDNFAVPVSLDFAVALLRRDASRYELAVKQAVNCPLAQPQFDALVSLAYNIGEGNFKGSTLVLKLNGGNAYAAAAEFDRWVYATVGGRKQVLDGLVKRRAAERALFLSGGD